MVVRSASLSSPVNGGAFCQRRDQRDQVEASWSTTMLGACASFSHVMFASGGWSQAAGHILRTQQFGVHQGQRRHGRRREVAINVGVGRGEGGAGGETCRSRR